MAPTPAPLPSRLSFDDFDLDIGNARLWQAGLEIPLPPKSFALLAHLAQRPGELVLKDTLLDTVWGRRFVSEGAVKTVVSELRAALGDDARSPRWIETVQRRGYRFLGQVRAADGAASASPAPAAASPKPPAGAVPAAPIRSSLPTGLQALVGRAQAHAQVEALLASTRMVTLCGPAGVGKTSLALAVANGRREQYPGGVWLAELAPLPADSTDEAALRGALARACQIPPASVPSDAAMIQALQGPAQLLVLDNAEHLLETLAPLVARLQRELPQLQWLVTSREPMQIQGEQVLRLAPLSLPPPGTEEDSAQLSESGAMQLLAQRVSARLPGFEPGPGQRRAMARVCRALDGLPLALELAAARVPVLGMHGLAAHLAGDTSQADEPGARLQLLTHTSRSALPHQRTLRSALDWSHMLLKPNEQRAFRRLAVFRGGFTLAAAQSVCANPDESPLAVLDALEALVEKSMVVVVAQDQGDSEHRFTLLESLREYASERLQAAAEVTATHRRHLAWMRAYWARADENALADPGMAWAARHLPELDNLRVALRWAQTQTEAPQTSEETGEADRPVVLTDWLALVGHTVMLWQRAGLLAEGGAWCLAARVHAQNHPDTRLRAVVDLALASLTRYMPLLPLAEALQLSERAAEVFRSVGDTVRAYFSLYMAWALALEIGEHLPREGYVQGMQALVQPGWNALLRRYVRLAAAQDQRLLGQFETFLQYSREDFEHFRAIGAQGEAWSAGMGLIWAESDQGHPERALAIGAALVDDIRAAGRLRTYAQLLAMHTTMRAESGDIAGTRALLPDALPMLSTVSACEVLLLALAWLATHEGRDEHAARLLGWFDAPARGGGAYGPNTYTRRSASALATRLVARLGQPRLQALQAEAAELGNERAMAMGLATRQTDAKQTAS